MSQIHMYLNIHKTKLKTNKQTKFRAYPLLLEHRMMLAVEAREKYPKLFNGYDGVEGGISTDGSFLGLQLKG